MADEKTEQPTAKRLRDARQKGQVAKSQDVPSALSVLAVGLYLMVLGPDIYVILRDCIEVTFQNINLPFDQALPKIGVMVFQVMLRLVGPFLAVVLGVVLLANLAQVGVLFSFESAKPKLENLSPGQWFKKVFALKNAFELFKNVLKVVVLSWASYIIFRDNLKELFRIPQSNMGAMWTILGQVCISLILTSACIFCVLAAFDFFFQKWQFTKQNMMSKDEVKREFKESEGDPMIKGKRKQLHQELLTQNNLNNVRKAKVLVVNPTHIAVALDYDKETIPLPLILAKGEGEVAKRMIAIAKEEGIPIMRNVPLAHDLFNEGTEGNYIPKNLIEPVAEVLKWALQL
ncbi:MAG: type III secretion system export apparatus subunit SctU [Desulfovibrionaceae bacterium]|nr:type III secretion system export apparatus subunit SctU [Desulfovibrionaceae bacterium]